MKKDREPDANELSREWGTYMVKAKVSEDIAERRGEPWPNLKSSEIKEYHESIAKDFESHIYLWPTPILTKKEDLKDILIFRDGKKLIRVYPPFPVNESSETSGAFEDVSVPEGTHKLERWGALPTSVVRGARMEHGIREDLEWCRAFRLDVEKGADGLSTLLRLLDHVAQFTHQWWIRASHNPMLGPVRMGGEIKKDFSIATELRHRGAGDVESTWYGACPYQPTLGFGSPLKKGGWLLSAHHTQEGRKADQGLLAFYDGMADYMAGRDDKAILNLCIATEIMLSKHSTAILKKVPSKLEKAIRTTKLVGKPIREKLKHLRIDRNDVAHGREPHLIGQGKENTIEIYIQAVRHLVSAYLKAMPLGEWPKIMDLRLENPKILKGRNHT